MHHFTSSSWERADSISAAGKWGVFCRPPGAAGPQREKKSGVADLAPSRKVKKRKIL